MMTKKNIYKHELIGLPAKIVNATHSGYVGLKGLIVDETMKTIVLEVDNVEKVIPKKGTKIRVSIPEEVVLDGSALLYRPQDRIKKAGR